MDSTMLKELVGLNQQPARVLAEDTLDKLFNPVESLMSGADDKTVVRHDAGYALRTVVVLPAVLGCYWNKRNICPEILDMFSAPSRDSLLDASESIIFHLEQCFGIKDAETNVLVGRQKINKSLVIVANWLLKSDGSPVYLFAKSNLTAKIPEHDINEGQSIILVGGSCEKYLKNFNFAEVLPSIVLPHLRRTTFRGFGETSWEYRRLAPKLEMLVD